jgi:hypothetical protein
MEPKPNRRVARWAFLIAVVAIIALTVNVTFLGNWP